MKQLLRLLPAVALPWYWAVGLATDGEFLRSFFFEHNLGRATETMEHHGGSVFFYPLAILVGFFPWSVFALPLAIDTALQIRRNDRFHPSYLFAVCWIGVYVVLFSLARTSPARNNWSEGKICASFAFAKPKVMNGSNPPLLVSSRPPVNAPTRVRFSR